MIAVSLKYFRFMEDVEIKDNNNTYIVIQIISTYKHFTTEQNLKAFPIISLIEITENVTFLGCFFNN